jgi:Putative Ig domain
MVKSIAIATTDLPVGQVPSDGKSHPYFARHSAINGVSDFTWSVSPALPTGLSLSADGVISGVPQTESSGVYTFTVVSNGNSDSKDLSLTIVSVEVQAKNESSSWTPCQQITDTAITKSLVGSARSSSKFLPAKRRNVQQIKVSTTVQGQKLIRTVTLSS